jgi:hypothetical protein
MLKVDDYLEHAAECRRMAASATIPAVRDDLLIMAESWEMLAEQRRHLLQAKGEWLRD